MKIQKKDNKYKYRYNNVGGLGFFIQNIKIKILMLRGQH